MPELSGQLAVQKIQYKNLEMFIHGPVMIGQSSIRVHKADLFEANIFGIGSEALPAHVEAIFANQPMSVRAHTAEI